MNRLKTFAVASCVGLLAVAFMPRSKADEWNKKTILTVNEPLAIPGKVLQPGKYVMRLMDSPAERHVVQIFNEDESQIEATVIAIPNYRIQPSDKTEFAFWEMPAGQARALKAWFYPGDNFGQEFAYPKDLATTIAKNNNESVPTVSEDKPNEITQMAPSGETEQMAQSTPPAAPPDQSNSSTSAVTAESTSPVMSDNGAGTGAPSPVQSSAAPSAAPMSNPAGTQANTGNNLPRTASPYPLVGLTGLLSLGAAIAARVAAKHLA
jgi:hypothetical protein